MFDEIEDGKTERLIASKRHNELKDLLVKLSVVLNKKSENTDNGLSESIANQSQSIKELVTAILSQPKPEKPQVNVEVNQDKLVSSIEGLEVCIDKILKGQEEILRQLTIMNQPKEWLFDVERNNYTQRITTVTAKMNYNKPKYQA